jgi:hypothetical protein
MTQYLWLIFLLILVFLLVRNSTGFGNLVSGLSHAQSGAIVALQGGDPGPFLNQ